MAPPIVGPAQHCNATTPLNMPSARAVPRAESAHSTAPFRAAESAPSWRPCAARAAISGCGCCRRDKAPASDEAITSRFRGGEHAAGPPPSDRVAHAAPVSSSPQAELKAFHRPTASASLGRRTRRGWWRAPPSAPGWRRATIKYARRHSQHPVLFRLCVSFLQCISPLFRPPDAAVAERTKEAAGDSAKIIFFARPNPFAGPNVCGVIGGSSLARAGAHVNRT